MEGEERDEKKRRISASGPILEARLKVLLTQQQIAQGVDRLAQEISRDYQGRRPLLIGVLKGAFVFLADLIRRLEVPAEVEFVRLSSYSQRRESSGRVRLLGRLGSSLRGRDVVVVEDIVDSGLTLQFLLEYLQAKRPASLRLCSLFVKGSPQEFPFHIHYWGFQVPKVFVVGYGLDFNQQYRHLPDLRVFEEEVSS